MKRKLTPHYIRSYKVVERIGKTVYKLKLLVGWIHNVFCMSLLRKCLGDLS